MSITSIEDIDIYINSNNYDYFFFQITKSDISKNIYLENYVMTTYVNSYYTDISNETIYNYFYNLPTYTSILFICIKSLYTNMTNAKPDYLLLQDNNNPIDNTILIKNFIENKFINTLGYINSTYDLNFIQITKPTINKIDISNVYTTFTNYEYKDISNSAIFNYYNYESTRPLFLIFMKEFNTIIINKTDYLYIDGSFNKTSITNYINNKVIQNLNLSSIYDKNIIFIQIIKNNMILNTSINNTITEYVNKYKLQYLYRTIISSQTFNYFSNDSKPILLINIKENYNILSNSYNYDIYNYTQIDNKTTVYSIEFFIQTYLLPKPIENINQLSIYLKYTLYELTFIRLLNTSTDSIKASYIITILNEYNNTYKKSYEYIEIVNNIEINNLYKALVKIYPAILLFKKGEYTIDRYRVPCRILSGENYYTENSIIQLKNFIKYSLNY